MTDAQRGPRAPDATGHLPGRPGLRARRLAPDRQRHRDRQVPAVAAARLRTRAVLRPAGRGPVPRRAGRPAMTDDTERQRRVQLVGMLLIAAAGTAAYWIGAGADDGLRAAAILFGFVLVLHVGRRRSAT